MWLYLSQKGRIYSKLSSFKTENLLILKLLLVWDGILKPPIVFHWMFSAGERGRKKRNWGNTCSSNPGLHPRLPRNAKISSHTSLCFFHSLSSSAPLDPSGRIIESWERQLHFNCPRRGHRGGGTVAERKKRGGGQWKGNKELKINSFQMRGRRERKHASEKVSEVTLHLRSRPTPKKKKTKERRTWEKQDNSNYMQ